MTSTTICMTDTSVVPFPTLDPTYTQTSNAAASPLPHIPCRSARLGALLSLSHSIPLSSPSVPVDYAPYMRYDSGSSSSSGTLSDEIRPTIVPRSKRVPSHRSTFFDARDFFTHVMPVSTPVNPRADGSSFADIECRKQTPLRDISDDEDTLPPFQVLGQAPVCKVGKLRLEGSTGKQARHTSDSTVPFPVPSAREGATDPQQPLSSRDAPAVRKKSGQPVKSSLKSARPPQLHVVTDGSFAQSEPATPTHTKAVHFDSKLEHVKLFLAGQKPLAVSRDGSPTTDTSGDEFPSYIYGDSSCENRQVKMIVPNMPSSTRTEEIVALQELILSQDQRMITGRVRVRNIAFEKWLAVRFTLDWWQTTSEVTARYDESVEGGACDIFTFSIRLHDIWSHIEDKTIFIAVRYTVAGKEYWDNNAGQNYHIKFVLGSSDSSSAVDNEMSLWDLNSRLEEVANARSSPISIAPYRLARSFSADYQPPLLGKSLSSRYDFISAYKTQSMMSAPPSNRHARTHTYPSAVPAALSPTTAPWSNTQEAVDTKQVTSPPRPPLPLGSPEAMGGTPTLPVQKPALSESPMPSRIQDGRERNHRRGYVDRFMEGSPNVRKTPVGSLLKFDLMSKDAAAQLPRTRSYPLTAERPGPMGSLPRQLTTKPPLSIQIAPVDDGKDQEPTPDEASQSSSSSTSVRTPMSTPGSVCSSSRSDATYKQFLDQFCFYTGTDSLQELSEVLPRSQSASSIEQYMLSRSPPHSFSTHMGDLATSAHPAWFSFDSTGSATPTAVNS